MIDSFVGSWKVLLATPRSGKKEVDADHPLRLVYGATDNGEALFFSITEAKPGLPDLSNVVGVERGVRKIDGKWTLSLTLRDPRFQDVFMRLCEDLARRSATAVSELQAMNYFLAGVAEWKQLLRNPLDDRLSLEAIRGLIAELWFGFRYLSQRHSVSAVLAAWTGPMGSPQDFNFAGDQSFEVKSTYADTKSIRVSSADQLDVGGRQLTLAVVGVERSASGAPNAFSLPSLVSEVEAEVKAETSVSDLYRRFDALHLRIADEYYSDFWFEITDLRRFQVTPEFPAIRASHLNTGVQDVTYSIMLRSMSTFLLDDDADD